MKKCWRRGEEDDREGSLTPGYPLITAPKGVLTLEFTIGDIFRRKP